MSKAQVKLYKSELAKELETLARILGSEARVGKKSLIVDPKPLTDAAVQCKPKGSSSSTKWKYSIQKLRFLLPDKDGTKRFPTGVSDLQLELTVTISGDCSTRDLAVDPFVEYSLEIDIAGTYKSDKVNKKALCSWHLDRDIPPEKGKVQQFMHPCYHFHFGGRSTWDSALDFGATLLLEAPRLAFPPLDGILAVDYVLTNYYGHSHLKFREGGSYQKLVRAAQDRCWRPYVRALASRWPAYAMEAEEPWLPTKIWPQIVPAAK
jgi:hypothetical protein